LHPHPHNLVPADELFQSPRKRGKELIGEQCYIDGYFYSSCLEPRLNEKFSHHKALIVKKFLTISASPW
ncbi:MAG: hypothetical protein Q4D61_01355, partial [Cardiobacteriaceae bacterium]|nr:hypothetical protein [Cardiobacteriaceae bacterium]